MTPLEKLEAFNVRIAAEASGSVAAYDALLAKHADEARELIREASIGLTPGSVYYGTSAYIAGIAARLKAVTR